MDTNNDHFTPLVLCVRGKKLYSSCGVGGGRGKKIVGELKLCVCVCGRGAIFKLHSFLGRNR